MDLIDTEELRMIFGEDSHGLTLEDRARTSSRVFVRSQDHLSLDNPTLTGRRLSAWEALQSFDLDVLREVIEYSSAILPANLNEPAKTLSTRRESLGFSIEDIARITGLSDETIRDAENPKTRTSIWAIEKIAQVLALDEHAISFEPQARGDKGLAIRLKELGHAYWRTPLVSRICEAAWVIKKQRDLRRWCNPNQLTPIDTITPSDDYGNASYPPWRVGYLLASQTRRRLGIPADKAIEKLHHLIEKTLGIPVVQQELPQMVAGATIANGSARGITVNITGFNQNVWVRRMTLAHELGHLLWDPDPRLSSIQVDDYSEIDKNPQNADQVEARANAFAVEFLAPREAALRAFQSHPDHRVGLRNVMEGFGLSFTSARYHIWNALDRSFSLDSLNGIDLEPTDEWKISEECRLDYFQPSSVPYSRRGLFARLVVDAVDSKLMTEESAAMYLDCTVGEYQDSAEVIRQIFD